MTIVRRNSFFTSIYLYTQKNNKRDIMYVIQFEIERTEMENVYEAYLELSCKENYWLYWCEDVNKFALIFSLHHTRICDI